MESQEKIIKDIFQNHSKVIVREICNQIESIEKRPDLSESQKFSILKDLNKQLIYKEFRTLSDHIRCFSKGMEFSIYKIHDHAQDQ